MSKRFSQSEITSPSLAQPHFNKTGQLYFFESQHSKMAIRFRIVRFIFAIAVLILIVQVLTTIHFSSMYSAQDSLLKARRNIYKFQERLQTHVGHSEREIALPFSPNKKDQEIDVKQPLIAPPNEAILQGVDPGELQQSFGVPCENFKHKDASSAYRRAKSPECKKQIARIACLSETKKLYHKNIKRLCPVPRSKGTTAKWVDVGRAYGPPIRIVYVLSLHGRAFRQVRRLFKALYHSHHYFYFHVDSRSDYLRREVEDMIKDFSENAAIAPWSMATIWGGASLLKMLLRSMEDLVAKTEWKWDYFINLSESDYPIKANFELVKFLRGHRDYNFLKPHGRDTQRFIRKQGLDRTFFECEEHMWRLGGRELPEEIDIDGGSDWIALNKKFCHYLVTSDDSLVSGLKHMYGYSLLPAESFFHTVLRNSPHCEKFIKTNLRLTNWKRKLGCRCQYKHIVDWCGCSPNDFKTEEMSRIKSQTTNYFARKFEAIVNQAVINQLDEWLFGEVPADTPAMNFYWENLYHHQDTISKPSDTFTSFFYSFASLGVKQLNIQPSYRRHADICRFSFADKVREVHYLNQFDLFAGLLVLYDASFTTKSGEHKTISLETWLSPITMEEMMNLNMSKGPSRLIGLEVGTGWDQKERVFRNFAKMIGPKDDPVLVHRWLHGEPFDVKIMWIDPINVITGIYEMHVVDNWVISFHKPVFKKPMRPGRWTIKLVYSDKGEDLVIGQTFFLVVPLAFDKGRPLMTKTAVELNNGPPGGIYNPHDLSIEFDREANNTEALAKSAATNARKTDGELRAWSDDVISEFWNVETTCSPSGPIPECPTVRSCGHVSWSSRSPDPKSEIGKVKPNGRIR